MTNKQFRLTSRPAGEATASNFTLVETPVPDPPMGRWSGTPTSR